MPTVPLRYCSVEVCDRPLYAKTFCSSHYMRSLQGKDLSQPIKAHSSPGKRLACSVIDCQRFAVALGYCNSHWAQHKRYGIEPRPLRRMTPNVGKCSFEKCHELKRKGDYCLYHYSQHITQKPLRPYRRSKAYSDRQCIISGCETNQQCINMMCKRHDALCYIYKLSSVQIEMLWAGGCMICGSTEDLNIDHDHNCCSERGRKDTCGECVRGCLCRECNSGLGRFKDDPVLLETAIAYLVRLYS